MFFLIRSTQRLINTIVSRCGEMEPEEHIRLNHYVWIALFALPVSSAAILYNLSIYNYTLSFFIGFFALFLFSSLFVLHKIHSKNLLYSSMSLIFIFLIFYMLNYVEACDSSKILWAYIFPLASIFLMGSRTGFIWSMFLLILIVLLFIFSHKLHSIFVTSFQIRFAVTYFVVASIASWIESYRNQYQNESIKIHKELLSQQQVLEKEIERRILLEKELMHIAQTDSLTQTYNRYYFWEKAGQELERSKRYGIQTCLAILDIDHFKAINDTYGHPTGDKVLQVLSQHCKASLRNSDIFARIGGEEFAFLLLHVNLDEARAKMETLREEISRINVLHLNETPLSFTVSIGLSALNDTLVNLDQLFKEADERLYLAKKEGRNCIR